jgi:hypothetical protein
MISVLFSFKKRTVPNMIGKQTNKGAIMAAYAVNCDPKYFFIIPPKMRTIG